MVKASPSALISLPKLVRCMLSPNWVMQSLVAIVSFTIMADEQEILRYINALREKLVLAAKGQNADDVGNICDEIYSKYDELAASYHWSQYEAD